MENGIDKRIELETCVKPNFILRRKNDLKLDNQEMHRLGIFNCDREGKIRRLTSNSIKFVDLYTRRLFDL